MTEHPPGPPSGSAGALPPPGSGPPPPSRPSGPLPSLGPPGPVVPPHVARRFFLRVDYWGILIGISAAVALSLQSFYDADSWWVGLGVLVTVLVALHTLLVSRHVPWIPGLIALVSLVQWVIAPWVNYHIPPDVSLFEMSLPPTEYFSYAVPAAVLFAVGMYVPMWRAGRARVERRTVVETRDFRRTCDLMIIIGTIAFIVLPVMPFSVRFLFTLLTYLAFVGAFGLMLVNERGWTWRLLFVLAIRMAMSTSQGLFHDFLLWGVYSAALLAYAKRLRPITLVGMFVVGGFFIGVLNEAKLIYRTEIKLTPTMPLSDRLVILSREFANQAEQPSVTFTGDALGHFVTRLNQGWIIARTIFWVPASEPYANGETIMNAFRAALIPRVLDPGKYQAGGSVYFQRFTGFTLYNDTSMNLSVAGEMYVNFGLGGGLIGVFLFGLGIGVIYRFFAGLAARSPLWWAWAPYVLLYSMQAENGIGEGVNHVAKSFLVMMTVVYTIPAWQAMPKWSRRRMFRLT